MTVPDRTWVGATTHCWRGDLDTSRFERKADPCWLDERRSSARGLGVGWEQYSGGQALPEVGYLVVVEADPHRCVESPEGSDRG